MIGSEHYRQAELLLSSTAGMPQFEDGSSPWADRALQAAQVHATLALAAATALTGAMAAESYTDEPELKAWHDAAGVKAEPVALADETVPIGGVAPGTTVSCSVWNDGNPVRICRVYNIGHGRVRVRFRSSPEQVDDDVDVVWDHMEVTPCVVDGAVPPLSDADKARADLAAESLTALRSKLAGPVVTP